MALLRLASFPLVVKPISSSSSFNENHRNRNRSKGWGGGRRYGDADVPARDRVVSFGKYKGRMLGTLPSKYLTWLFENVEVWGARAKEVLSDPVYQDRLEWDVCERFLSGDYLDDGTGGRWARMRTREVDDDIATMLEISNRFGWDNADKDAWDKINFNLLGTSFGGRIPRKNKNPTIHMDSQHHHPLKKLSHAKKSSAAGGSGIEVGYDDDDEKMLRKEGSRVLTTQQKVVHLRRRFLGGEGRVVVGGARPSSCSSSSGGDGGADGNSNSGPSPFPGREALLDRVMKRSG